MSNIIGRNIALLVSREAYHVLSCNLVQVTMPCLPELFRHVLNEIYHLLYCHIVEVMHGFCIAVWFSWVEYGDFVVPEVPCVEYPSGSYFSWEQQLRHVFSRLQYVSLCNCGCIPIIENVMQ